MGVLSAAKKNSAVSRQRKAQVLQGSGQLWDSRSSPVRTERFSFYGQGSPHEVELTSQPAGLLRLQGTEGRPGP